MKKDIRTIFMKLKKIQALNEFFDPVHVKCQTK